MANHDITFTLLPETAAVLARRYPHLEVEAQLRVDGEGRQDRLLTFRGTPADLYAAGVIHAGGLQARHDYRRRPLRDGCGTLVHGILCEDGTGWVHHTNELDAVELPRWAEKATERILRDLVTRAPT